MSTTVQTEEKTRVLDLGQVIEHRCKAECFEELDGTYRRIIWILKGWTGELVVSVYADGWGSEEASAPLVCAPTHGWQPFDCQDRAPQGEYCPGCPLAEQDAA